MKSSTGTKYATIAMILPDLSKETLRASIATAETQVTKTMSPSAVLIKLMSYTKHTARL